MRKSKPLGALSNTDIFNKVCKFCWSGEDLEERMLFLYPEICDTSLAQTHPNAKYIYKRLKCSCTWHCPPHQGTKLSSRHETLLTSELNH